MDLTSVYFIICCYNGMVLIMCGHNKEHQWYFLSKFYQSNLTSYFLILHLKYSYQYVHENYIQISLNTILKNKKVMQHWCLIIYELSSKLEMSRGQNGMGMKRPGHEMSAGRNTRDQTSRSLEMYTYIERIHASNIYY